MDDASRPIAEPGPPRRWWPRMVARVVVALLVLHIVGLGAASWYYASRIDSDALQVRPPGPWPENLTVTAVDPAAGTITLGLRPGVEGADTLEQLRSPKVFGLHWTGGFAQSRGDAVVHGSTVTRRSDLIEGDWPTVGAAIGSHTFAFPQGPRPPWTSITFEGPDGPLRGYLSPANTPAGPSTTWAIMVHGKGAEPDEFDRLMPTVVAAGITAFAIHYRGDPGLPPEPDHRYGFGAHEWPDLAAAVEHARQHGARRVVLIGASMGGAVVASYLRHEPDAATERGIVRAVVLDSPALDLSRVVRWGADQIALPGGIPLPSPVTWGAQRLTSLRTGLDWGEVDYVSDPSWDSVPTLVFHGTLDRTVPVTISRDLAARRAQVALVEVPAADHVESWNVDPGAYERHLTEFLGSLERP